MFYNSLQMKKQEFYICEGKSWSIVKNRKLCWDVAGPDYKSSSNMSYKCHNLKIIRHLSARQDSIPAWSSMRGEMCGRAHPTLPSLAGATCSLTSIFAHFEKETKYKKYTFCLFKKLMGFSSKSSFTFAIWLHENGRAHYEVRGGFVNFIFFVVDMEGQRGEGEGWRGYIQ